MSINDRETEQLVWEFERFVNPTGSGGEPLARGLACHDISQERLPELRGSRAVRPIAIFLDPEGNVVIRENIFDLIAGIPDIPID